MTDTPKSKAMALWVAQAVSGSRNLKVVPVIKPTPDSINRISEKAATKPEARVRYQGQDALALVSSCLDTDGPGSGLTNTLGESVVVKLLDEVGCPVAAKAFAAVKGDARASKVKIVNTTDALRIISLDYYTITEMANALFIVLALNYGSPDSLLS